MVSLYVRSVLFSFFTESMYVHPPGLSSAVRFYCFPGTCSLYECLFVRQHYAIAHGCKECGDTHASLKCLSAINLVFARKYSSIGVVPVHSTGMWQSEQSAQ